MPILFIILLLTTVEQFAVDVYLPSMPAMSEFFKVPDAMVQLSLSLYMVGFALSPLIAGPITDRYGRRNIILLGLLCLFISTLFCIFTSKIHILLLGRVLMGAACGILVVANQAMVRDSFQGSRLVKVSSYMSMTWSTVPIVAPAIGGYVQHYWDWQGNFILIALYVLLGLVFCFFGLKETMVKNPRPVNIKAIYPKYLKLLKQHAFLVYVLCTAVTFALTTGFITAAPFLFQDTLGFSPVEFGWLALAVAVSYLLGTYVNNILLNYFLPHQLIRAGIGLLCTFSVLGLVLGFLSFLNPYAIALPIAAVIFSEGLVYPNAAALTFEPITKNIGIASALYICLQLLACALSSAIVAKLPEHNQIPLMSFMLALNVLLAVVYFLNRKRLAP